MAQRIITKIGDIFCARMGDRQKCYFQYVANDRTQLNSAVICVFRKHYLVEDTPSMEDVITDTVHFYAHTMLKTGIEYGAWEKVGHIKNIRDRELQSVLFGYTRNYTEVYSQTPEGTPSVSISSCNPLENWFVWKAGQPLQGIGQLPHQYVECLEPGTVYSFASILDRMRTGYYSNSDVIYDVLRRKPLPEVNSYVRRYDKDLDAMRYLHFLGETVIREIDVFPNRVVRLSKTCLQSDGCQLFCHMFGDINWTSDEFIREKDFETKWNQKDRKAMACFLENGTIFDVEGVNGYAFEGNDKGQIDRGQDVCFAEYFPDVVKQYQQLCAQKQFDIGNLAEFRHGDFHVYALGVREIINKVYVGEKRRDRLVKDLQQTLHRMLDAAERERVSSIAISSIGLGLCGLSWEELQVIVNNVVRFHHNITLHVVKTAMG